MKRCLLLLLAASLLTTGCAALVREGKRGFFSIVSGLSRSDVQITLDRSFIDRYKDRATIDLTFDVDRAGRRAHPSYLDGDLHVAGRAPEIGLPIVAEVVNAKSQRKAVEAVQRAAEIGETVRLTGAWRVWSEHFGDAEETQGTSLPRFERTNPPHVFEVHPVSRLGDIDLAGTFTPVPGFRPEQAVVVFRSLGRSRCTIVSGEQTVTIFARRREFNDADFVMEVGPGEQQAVSDGRFVRAAVLSRQGERLANDVRMVFVKDTAPEKAVKDLPSGSRLQVFGIPRIDLAEVAARADRGREDPGALKGDLPYEIVVVGVFAPTL